MQEHSESQKKIRSFVRREGRITEAQTRALNTLWDIYGLTTDQGLLNREAVFGNTHDCVLEIGFGMGHSLAMMAQQNPTLNFIGIEVHRPGVGTLMNQLELQQASNVRLYQEDALEVLERCIPDASLIRVNLFFPDPWPKARHHKRRIVNTAFADLIARKLKPGGIFHLATDWENYKDHMLEVLTPHPLFLNLFAPHSCAPGPWERPETKFEARGKKLGHGVWDLVFKRRAV